MREEIDKFSEMIATVLENHKEKGDMWKHISISDLYKWMTLEVNELYEAIFIKDCIKIEEIQREAADIAAYCMFIALRAEENL
jgi:NTP pyrophosphatase (non-canonical NTP hydrolase)